MKIAKLLAILSFSITTISSACAEELPFKVIGTTLATVSKGRSTLLSANPASKQILLQKIELSNDAKKNLIARLEALESSPMLYKTNASAYTLPATIDLKMNGVPVLDQGKHGTCVTFATTAAIDAAYGKGNYISQLCNLSLGNYLARTQAGYDSGWDGSTNALVMSQIKRYGIISMSYQLTEGCAGVKEYPLMDATNHGNELNADEFSVHSENIMATMSTANLLKAGDAFTKRDNSDVIFGNAKSALANEHRILIGFLLDDSDGSAGAYGTYQSKDDSWIITSQIHKHFKRRRIVSGHAIIITGYDDNAIIHGPNNTEHKGAFILRNSWGDMSGDHGNYYMSYEYFKTFVDEAIELKPTPAM